MIVVVLSTITGILSVYARARVMREIWSELHLGLAVVPSIATLLHAHKAGAGPAHAHTHTHTHARGSQVQAGSGTLEQQPASGSLDSASALGPARDQNRKKKQTLAFASFGQPLLQGDSIDSADLEEEGGSAENSVERELASATSASAGSSSAHRINSSGGSGAGPVYSSQPRQGSFSRGSFGSFGSSGGGSSPNPSRGRSNSLQSGRSGGSDESSVLKVRLSSKDPNVQLAWVQRTISTTKLTSLNLIFATLPFLVLNQIRIFRNDSIRQDWALQLSSLFATVLLGVKLLRILSLGELLQRRNELVFEVVIAGTSKAAGAGMVGSAGAQARAEQQGIKIGGGGGSSSFTPNLSHSHTAAPFSMGSLPHRFSSGAFLANGSRLSMGPTGSPLLTASAGDLMAVAGSHGSPTQLEDGFVMLDAHSVADWHGADLHGSASGGGMLVSMDGALSPGDPQSSLQAPPSSLTSPFSTQLFAPSASFNSVEPIGDDHASAWARANAGSALMIAQRPQPPSLQQQQNSAASEGHRHSDFLAPPLAQSSSSSSSSVVGDGSGDGDGGVSSRTSSSGTATWIQQHMLMHESPPAALSGGRSPSTAPSSSGSNEATHMTKIKKRGQAETETEADDAAAGV
jgi:hypothetical protein